jgi:hypothetical protein
MSGPDTGRLVGVLAYNLTERKMDKWEFVDGYVIDEAYEGSGLINAPGCNGSVFISNGEHAKWLVDEHNKLVDAVEADQEFLERDSPFREVPTLVKAWEDAEEAFMKLKSITKRVPAGSWTPEYRELAEAVHALGREVFYVRTGDRNVRKNSGRPSQGLPRQVDATLRGQNEGSGETARLCSRRTWLYGV